MNGKHSLQNTLRRKIGGCRDCQNLFWARNHVIRRISSRERTTNKIWRCRQSKDGLQNGTACKLSRVQTRTSLDCTREPTADTHWVAKRRTQRECQTDPPEMLKADSNHHMSRKANATILRSLFDRCGKQMLGTQQSNKVPHCKIWA